MINQYKFTTNAEDALIDKIKTLSTTGTYLLDITNTNLDELEQFVYKTTLYHYPEFDLNTHYIEFWCKTGVDLKGFHLDCDEQLKKEMKYVYPLLSCVSYFNDLDNYPFALTNIDLDKYMYKEFENEKNMYLVFPRKMRQITFNKPYYHGVLNVNTTTNDYRPIIAMNIWDRKPTNIAYYKNCANTNQIQLQIELHKTEEEQVLVSDCILNKNLFEAILYKKNNTINIDIVNYEPIIVLTKDEGGILSKVNYKKKDIFAEMKSVIDIKNIDNRFIQRHKHTNIFSKEVCDWIVFEAEAYASKNGWTTRRHVRYPTTDIPAEKIVNIFSYLMFGIKPIIEFIIQSYNITGANSNIKDLFIVKYEESQQNYLEFHTDGSLISFNIALNDITEYEGGGTTFEDGIIVKQNKGDLLVHSSLVKHAGVPIVKGKRYILVGFVDFNIITDRAI